MLVCVLVFLNGLAVADSPPDYPDSRWAEQLASAEHEWRFDLDSLNPGEIRRTQFLGRTVYIVKRYPEEVDRLNARRQLVYPFGYYQLSIVATTKNASQLLDARINTAGTIAVLDRPLRSLDDDVFVVFGESPYTGCSPHVIAQTDSRVRFRDLCSGAEWDAVGLPIKTGDQNSSDPAVFPLFVPPYQIDSDELVLGGSALPERLPHTDTLVLRRLDKSGDPQQRLATGARWNLPDLVSEALKEGAHPNVKINDEDKPYVATALTAAISASSIEVIEMLLDHEAVPSGRDFEVAQLYRRPKVIALFCARGFRPDNDNREIVLEPPLPEINCQSTKSQGLPSGGAQRSLR